MSTYPWNLLGIESASDEETIQRGYARMLKRYRPDEDPEGFARLVGARKLALALVAAAKPPRPQSERATPAEQAETGDAQGSSERQDSSGRDGFSSRDWGATGARSQGRFSPPQSEQDGWQGFSSRDWGATGGRSQGRFPPPQSERDGSQGFSSRDFGETATFSGTFGSNRWENQTWGECATGRAFTTTMARLRYLLHGRDRRSPGPSWDATGWRSALAQTADFSLTERRFLREFIVREALPLLPQLPSDRAMTENLCEGRGPGPVVVFWEEEFALAPDQTELTRLCGVPAMLCYLAWLDGTRRLTIELDRERVRASAFTEAMGLLQKLTRGAAGGGPTWDAAQWRTFLSEVSTRVPGMNRHDLRELIVREVLPLLPNLPSDRAAKQNLREGRGPGPVVLFWEEEFALASDQAELGRLCGVPAMRRYVAWLEGTRRLTIEIAWAPAFADAVDRLRQLVGGVDGAGPTWDLELWRLFLSEMSTFLVRKHRYDLREIVVKEALPLLPSVLSVNAAVNQMREGRGPGPVVGLLEDEFELAQRPAECARLCGDAAVRRYLDWLDCRRILTVERDRERARKLALTEAKALLKRLFRGGDGAELIWDAEKWRASLNELSGLFSGHSGGREGLREFVIREALPLLPEVETLSAATNDMREGRGPCPVVVFWEEQFAIARDILVVSRLSEGAAMLRYLQWLTVSVRACPLEKRSKAERDFVVRLNRVLPSRHATARVSPVWKPHRWKELFDLVQKMEPAEVARCRDLFAERLTAWLPELPTGLQARRRGKTDPAIVVEEIEREFAISERFDAPEVNAEGITRYRQWLAYAADNQPATPRWRLRFSVPWRR